MSTIYRIRSQHLRAQGQRFETADRKRAERRLRELASVDPRARIVAIPARGR